MPLGLVLKAAFMFVTPCIAEEAFSAEGAMMAKINLKKG